jgi:hypothetical protein
LPKSLFCLTHTHTILFKYSKKILEGRIRYRLDRSSDNIEQRIGMTMHHNITDSHDKINYMMISSTIVLRMKLLSVNQYKDLIVALQM